MSIGTTGAATSEVEYDLFVIGGGSGGIRAARMAAALGARVALAEGGDLGGTCVNLGCIPKKLYSYAAGYAESFSEARGFGWSLPAEPKFDWTRLKRARAEEIGRLNRIYAGLLDTASVTAFSGWARLDGPHSVVVNGTRHAARHVLLAAGSAPRTLRVPGGEHAVVSDQVFDLAHLPDHLVIVGGGYIACEFASIFRGLGSRVTMLLRSDRPLSGFDDEVRSFLRREMEKHGVLLRHGVQVERIDRDAVTGSLRIGLKDGSAIEADNMLQAVGRGPRTEGLGLDAAGVAGDEAGRIIVDRN